MFTLHFVHIIALYREDSLEKKQIALDAKILSANHIISIFKSIS